MKRFSIVLLVLAVALIAAPTYALKVYSNPSIQTNNVSPDGTYNEGYSMQSVSDLFCAKCANRGFSTRDSDWLSLSAACSDADAWNPNCFISEHTNAAGSGGWDSNHGTMGLYYCNSSCQYDAIDRSLCIKCVDNCIAQFATAGRGAKWGAGYYGDYCFYGTYNLYVLSHTPDMNSVLIEGLFHTNYEDCQLLKTSNGRNLYAEGLYVGVCQQYGYDPYPSPDIIIDNTDAGFSCSANWATGTMATDKYGTNYRYRSTAATSDPATWTPNIPTAGSWTIYAWWTAGTNRSPNSAYQVYYSGGSTNVYVNQQTNGGKWNVLTTQNLGTGTGYPVKKSCWATTGYVVIADAIKWHKN
ncbi:MAG: N-acetylmuramoyl-L-alanine amidase [Armatimonadota bacterium]|nr:N-acetylmuramoyl-L-alanine amidase [Armatimonadota bacterium]